MKILVDSNVIIRFWKEPTKAAENVFRSEETFICGVVRSELMHGARSEEDLERIRGALDEFGFLRTADGDWDLLGRMLYALRVNGLTVPFQDALLAMLAVKNKMPLWTYDRHFQLIKQIFPDLTLFEPDGGDQAGL